MKTFRTLSWRLLLVVGALFFMRGELHAEPKLPTAARQSIATRFPQAKIVGTSRQPGELPVRYLVDVLNGKEHLEVQVTPQGRIVEVGQEIAPAAVLPEIAAVVQQRHPQGSIESVYEITEPGPPLRKSWYLEVKTPAELMEMYFQPTGKFMFERPQPQPEKPQPGILSKEGEAAILKRFPHGTIETVSAIPDSSRVTVVLLEQEIGYELVVNAKGAILEISKEVEQDELPAAVLKAVQEKHVESRLLSAYEVTTAGAKPPVTYFMELETKLGVELEVTLTPSGKFILEETVR